MKAVTWHGKRDVRVETVPDPAIQEPTDAIIKVTSTNICGSDLHLYETLGPFMTPGDILGHEPMGIVEEVGSEVDEPRPSATGSSSRSRSPAATAACATSSSTPSARRPRCATRAWVPRCSATPSSTARCPGGQAEYLRVPAGPVHPHQGARRPAGRAVRLPLRRAADGVAGGRVRRRARRAARVVVLGLGPIGDMAARIAQHRGAGRSSASTWCPSASTRARPRGIEVARPASDVDDARATSSAT